MAAKYMAAINVLAGWAILPFSPRTEMDPPQLSTPPSTPCPVSASGSWQVMKSESNEEEVAVRVREREREGETVVEFIVVQRVPMRTGNQLAPACMSG